MSAARKKTAELALAALATATVGMTVLSSWATQTIAARLDHHPALGAPIFAGMYQPFAWLTWQQEPWAASEPRVFLPWRLGAMGLMLVGGVIVLVGAMRNTNRPVAYNTAHGTAKFDNEKEICRTGLLDGDGVVIGAWQDSKGRIHYLRHDGPEHIAAIAPTRSGKGVGLVIPTLLSWEASAVIMDEKAELWSLTAGWRKSIGQTVIRWAPGSPDISCGFNFLAEVRLRTEYEVADAQNIAVMIIDPEGRGLKDHWDRTAFGLLTGVILHVMYSKGACASLPDVAMALSDPVQPADALYLAMATNRHVGDVRHNVIASAGRDQMNREQKERSAVLSTVVSYMQLFKDPIVAKNSQHSDFRISDLFNAARPVSLYIQMPGSDKVRLRPLARLMMTMIVRGAVDVAMKFGADGQPMVPHRHRTLLMFDEFPSFGRLAVFEDALAKLAGFGIKAYLIMQDREQLIAAYGQNETILSNCGVQVVYAPNRWETAQWISRMTGDSTVSMEQVSESGKRGGQLNQVNRSITQISRPLMTPEEVMRLPGPTNDGSSITAPGEILVFGPAKIRGRQVLYFENFILLARSMVPPPARSDTLSVSMSFALA